MAVMWLAAQSGRDPDIIKAEWTVDNLRKLHLYRIVNPTIEDRLDILLAHISHLLTLGPLREPPKAEDHIHEWGAWIDKKAIMPAEVIPVSAPNNMAVLAALARSGAIILNPPTQI